MANSYSYLQVCGWIKEAIYQGDTIVINQLITSYCPETLLQFIDFMYYHLSIALFEGLHQIQLPGTRATKLHL